MKLILFLCILIALVIVSCSGSIPEPTPLQAEWAAQRWKGTDIAALSEGRNIYINRCSRCHGLKNPEHYTAVQWDKILNIMGKKAKLNDNEFEKVSHYVITMAKK
jgi:mono/diheme cytochrome c family protein